MRRACILLGLWLLNAPDVDAQNVWVVDGFGGAGSDFVEVNQAVAAAADGDIILVKPAAPYATTLISAKNLTIQGFSPTGPKPEIVALTVQNLSATQRVVLRGLRSAGFLAFSNAVLQISNCAGPVIVEDYAAPVTASQSFSIASVLITASSHVSLTRCNLLGPAGAINSAGDTAPKSALRVATSTVALYACDVTGGNGADAGVPPFDVTLHPAQAGAPGVDFASGNLFVAGGVLRGGAGGDGFSSISCSPSKDGAAGIKVGGVLTRMDCALVGGAGGVDAPGCPQVGVPGQGALVTSGSIAVINDSLRTLAVSAPGVEGQSVNTTIKGVAGEPVLLLLAFAPRVEYVPALRGTLIGAFPLVPIALGALPASGELSFDVTIPLDSLPPGVGGVHLYEQAIVGGATGTGLLSSPSVALILDDGS